MNTDTLDQKLLTTHEPGHYTEPPRTSARSRLTTYSRYINT
jgi:hypothetical protein